MATTLNLGATELSPSSERGEVATTHQQTAAEPGRRSSGIQADRAFGRSRKTDYQPAVWLDWTLIAVAILCLVVSVLVTMVLITPIE